MTRPSKTVTFDDTNYQDAHYTLLSDIAKKSGGWLASSGANGSSAEVWHEDTEYIFRGEALIRFLYAVKDNNVETIYQTLDFIDYIEKSEKKPPSVFVRDAIIQKARTLKTRIKGEG